MVKNTTTCRILSRDLEKLNKICEIEGWTQDELLNHLIDPYFKMILEDLEEDPEIQPFDYEEDTSLEEADSKITDLIENRSKTELTEEFRV